MSGPHISGPARPEVLFVPSGAWFSVLWFRCCQAWLEASNHGVSLACRSNAQKPGETMWQKSLSGGPSACTHETASQNR